MHCDSRFEYSLGHQSVFTFSALSCGCTVFKIDQSHIQDILLSILQINSYKKLIDIEHFTYHRINNLLKSDVPKVEELIGICSLL
jgi:hypothetical protein